MFTHPITIEFSRLVIYRWSIPLVIVLMSTNVVLHTVLLNQIRIIFQIYKVLAALAVSRVTAVNRVVAINNNPRNIILILIRSNQIVFKCCKQRSLLFYCGLRVYQPVSIQSDEMNKPKVKAIEIVKTRCGIQRR
jgi:hypothetical protein